MAEIGVRVPDRLCGPTPANRRTIFSSPLCSNRLKCKTLLETKSNNAKFIADIFGDVSSLTSKTGFQRNNYQAITKYICNFEKNNLFFEFLIINCIFTNEGYKFERTNIKYSAK